MSKNKTAVQETYTLPSRGKLYGDEFPEEVTIRSMTTFEEKMRLGNQGFYKTIGSILNAVVTSPEDFDYSQMTLFDFGFLMYKMRVVSYGPIYKVGQVCPYCKKEIICNVNLDELDVGYMEDDQKDPFTIGPLPRSGDTISCRHLRVKDAINNERKAKEILRDHPDYIGDPEYILTKASEIVSVNGEDKLPIEAQMYIEKMDAMDSAYFDQAYSRKTDNIGLSMICHEVCSNCGEELAFRLPFNSEFFRPTFDL